MLQIASARREAIFRSKSDSVSIHIFILRDLPMWCASCRADVAAELSTDNRRMLCARCQSELGIAASAPATMVNLPRVGETERDARELLARWSTQNLLDAVPSSTGGQSAKSATGAPTSIAKPQVRFDPPRVAVPAPTPPFVAATKDQLASSADLGGLPRHDADSPHRQDARVGISDQPRLDEAFVTPSQTSTKSQTSANSTGIPPVADTGHGHDQDRLVRDALQLQLNRRLGWSTFAGQLFAYGGVALLTCGTVLVMWSYFGGPPQYMPTGLLTAAVGQMLLFLGVVTLISSGMEQTVHEVSWRIDHLAEEIYHMGLSLDDVERAVQLRTQKLTDAANGQSGSQGFPASRAA